LSKKALLLQSIFLLCLSAVMLTAATFAWFYRDTRVQLFETNVGSRALTVDLYYFKDSENATPQELYVYGQDFLDSYQWVDPNVGQQLITHGPIYPGALVHYAVVVKNLGTLDSTLAIRFKNVFDDSPAEYLLDSMISNVPLAATSDGQTVLFTAEDSPYMGRKFSENKSGALGSRDVAFVGGLPLGAGQEIIVFFNLGLGVSAEEDITPGFKLTIQKMYFMLA